MEPQIIDLDLSTEIWCLLVKINAILQQSSDWSERLEQVNTVISTSIEADALWLLTIPPLPAVACGLVNTPLSNNPDAQIQIVDQAPSPVEDWPTNTLIKQVLAQQSLHFYEANQPDMAADLENILFGTFQTHSAIIIPLIANSNSVGVLAIACTHLTKQYNNPDIQKILPIFGQLLGDALQQTYNHNKTSHHLHTLTHQQKTFDSTLQQKNDELEFLDQVIGAVNVGHGLSETAELIVEQFNNLFTFHHLNVLLIDDTEQNVRQLVFNEYGSHEQQNRRIPIEKSTLPSLLNQPQGRIDYDISVMDGERLSPDNQVLIQDGIKCKMSVPFKTAKGLEGSFNMGHQETGYYSASDLDMLCKITPRLAVRIENAHLIDAMESHTNRLQMLNRLGEMLVSTTELERIVETTLSMLPRLLPGDVQAIIIASDEGAYLGVAVPYSFSRTQTTIEEIFDTFVEVTEGKLSNEIIFSKRIAGNMPVSNTWEPNTVFSLPILTRQGTLGIIYISTDKEDLLSNDMLRIFSLVASQVSAVVENASLFRQVEQERARLASILSSSTDAILVVQRNGRVVLDNPAAWQVMGVQTTQRGQQLANCTVNQPLIDLFETTIRGGKPNGEIPLTDGRTLFANLSPVSVGEHGIIGWVATMQDVSHFKELNELKNEFVNAVSHDLRSPLSSILIATHLMGQTGTINDSQKDLVETIERKVKSMSKLIHNLLDVGKIEAGIDMEMKSLAIIPILKDTIYALESQAENKSINLLEEIETSLPDISANETRLQQIFYNLIGNAIKYTPDNGRVTIKAFRHDNEIRIQVTDTGLGIPAADQPHIFEKFYRVRGEHVKSIKGTGLGLAITKSIVEKHQGRIWLESVFGEGSTFTTALPINP
ncbi:ATP-binding protein [Anaerolineales bacterium HSG6]|nr:ATP-binding protein [Anaerolineales bacterium HSG6]